MAKTPKPSGSTKVHNVGVYGKPLDVKREHTKDPKAQMESPSKPTTFHAKG